MINRGNIKSYIDFLHYKKYDIGAKEELLERWNHLSDFEITKQLTGLYQHWDIPTETAKRYEQAYLEKSEKVWVATPAPTVVPSASITTEEGDYSRYTNESSNKIPKIMAIIVGCVVVISGIVFFVNRQTELAEKTEQLDQKIQQVDQSAAIEQQANIQKEREAKRSEQERHEKIKAVKDNIESYVSKKVNYNYNGTFGGINNVAVVIKNNSAFKIEELTVTLVYIKKNGTIYETHDINFYNLPADAERFLAGPSSSRGTRMEAKITHVQMAE